jgi:hypothetical protein
VALEVDFGCDGSDDYCYTYSYDSMDNRTGFQADSGCDGAPETCVTMTYDCS